jgi:sulfonate dioxygenase
MALDISAAMLAYVPPDPPLKQFVPPRDRAFFADPKKISLLSSASSVEDLTPYIGTELKGIQISQLTDAQKDELALLVAEV